MKQSTKNMFRSWAKARDDEGVLNRAKEILSLTCEPMYLRLQGQNPSSKENAKGNYIWIDNVSSGGEGYILALDDGINLSYTYLRYNNPYVTFAGSPEYPMDVRSSVRQGAYDFAGDPDEVLLCWKMWDKDDTKADLEKMFNCKISDDIYSQLIKDSESWMVNRAGGSVLILYGRNDKGVLTARYAGAVSWNMVSNAANYSFIGVAADNKDIYGKKFSGNALYK